MSKLKDMTAKQEAAEEAAAEPSAEEVQLATLQEIRDLLKAQKNQQLAYRVIPLWLKYFEHENNVFYAFAGEGLLYSA